MQAPRRPKGLLRADAGASRFDLAYFEPSEALAPFVERYWLTHWDLTGRPDHAQEVLAHPCMHVVVDGDRSGVFGIVTGRFVRVLSGVGRAFGAKFWPGAFHGFLPGPAAELADERVPLGDAFGERGLRYEREVLATEDPLALVALANAFLEEQRPSVDPEAELARRIVERIAADRDIVRVEDVARDADLAPRRLQRLFHRYVGATPKWVIQRYRMHEAIEEIESGDAVDFADLAARLNYCDQAHFTRDFRRMIGATPAAYLSDLESKRG